MEWKSPDHRRFCGNFFKHPRNYETVHISKRNPSVFFEKDSVSPGTSGALGRSRTPHLSESQFETRESNSGVVVEIRKFWWSPFRSYRLAVIPFAINEPRKRNNILNLYKIIFNTYIKKLIKNGFEQLKPKSHIYRFS